MQSKQATSDHYSSNEEELHMKTRGRGFSS